MNYGQFLNMIPEATLTAMLLILFVADFILTGSEKKKGILRCLTCTLLLLQIVPCLLAGEADAFAGMYHAGMAANIMKAILTMGSLIVVLIAQPWLSQGNKYDGEFYMLIVTTLLGMYFMMSSGHFLLFVLGLETASVPMACLVAMDKWKKNSAEGAAKFILMATFSSGVMLYGLSFVYGSVGTLYFSDVATQSLTSPMCIMGMVFFFSGLGFKISIVPFHYWTADTYQGAPTPVTSYLSVISKGAAVFALYAIFTKVFIMPAGYWEVLLAISIVLTITVANLFAIRQRELKRFMAFSSISQAGYVLLPLLNSSEYGMASLIYYVLVYIAANLAVFAVINVLEQRKNGTTQMGDYAGLYKTNPKLAFLMTLALFSLAGIPPFAGMFSKFFAFMAAAAIASPLAYVVVFIALINTVISLYYYLLIVKEMYIKPNENPIEYIKSDGGTKLALALCTLGVVAFGVCSCLYDWIFAHSLL